MSIGVSRTRSLVKARSKYCVSSGCFCNGKIQLEWREKKSEATTDHFGFEGRLQLPSFQFLPIYFVEE